MIFWYQQSVQNVYKTLRANENGLTDKEAARRQKKEGKNILPRPKRINGLTVLGRQFKNPLIYLLLIAALITFALREYTDAGVILVAVILNVAVGFFQEFRAERSLEKLRNMVTNEAVCLRDGHQRRVPASDLVRGDIMVLRAGDKIPADGRLIQVEEFSVDEASLTGESAPVSKNTALIKKEVSVADQRNMVFLGTVVMTGEALAVVIAVGKNTEVGRVAALLRATETAATPLQERLRIFSKYLGFLLISLTIGLFIIGVIFEHSFAEMFKIAVAVAVSAIPEGLIISVTAILAVGMQRILKRRALVRRLVAAETLGSTTVICTDKTGTITEGKMVMTQVITLKESYTIDHHQKMTAPGRDVEHALEIALLCNDAHIENPEESMEVWRLLGSPTERALLLGAMRAGLSDSDIRSAQPEINQLPFTSGRKYRLSLHRCGKKLTAYAVGAPERLLPLCSYVFQDGQYLKWHSERRAGLMATAARLASQGLRVLAAVERPVKNPSALQPLQQEENNFVFVGLFVIEDPLRQEAKETIAAAAAAGIRTVLITGDHRATALYIAEALGLPHEKENVISGEELMKMDELTLSQRIKHISVFARVNPEDKLRIVKVLKEQGEVVAMTGDGVNDAPALRRADIGVAVGSGTDVAKEAADIVILDDRLSTIVAAVEEGRVIFANIRKVMLYLLSDSFAELFLLIPALLLGWPLPILATQILWINLIADGPPNLALTMEPAEGEVMKRQPRTRAVNLFNAKRIALVFLVSGTAGLGALFLFWFVLQYSGDLILARTTAFTALTVNTLLYVFSIRSLHRSILTMNPFRNLWLVGAAFMGLGLQIAVVLVPALQRIFQTVTLGLREWFLAVSLSLITLFIIEMVKLVVAFLWRRRQVAL